MQTTMIIISLTLMVLGIIIYIAKVKMKNLPVVADHEKIITLTDKNFSQQINNKTILIDFWASWCAPCRMMAPILNEVATELNNNTYVGKVNVEQYQSLAQRFKVQNIPTLILVKNGTEVKRFVGLKTKDFLLKQIHEI
jgi:thioredoxin 1